MRAMVIPQYSIRQLLVVTAICSGAFAVLGLAVRGNEIALAISIAILAGVVVVLAHVAAFAVVWAFSRSSLGRSNRQEIELPRISPPEVDRPNSENWPGEWS